MTDHNIRFFALDSLRGLASIGVAIFHLHGGWGGYLAVDFFLVLSGFILSHSYLYKDTATTTIDFVSHRLARLYPLHLYTLSVFIFVYFLIDEKNTSYADGTFFTIIQQLTLTQNIGFNPSGISWNYPNWSISVEFWVNVLFILFISKSTKNSSLFVAAIIGLIVIYKNTGHLDTHSYNYYNIFNSGIIRGISSFFIGILSYRIYLNYRDDIRIKKYINYIELLCIIGVIIVVFGRSGKFSGGDIFAPFVFMFVVATFAIESGRLSKQIIKFKYLGIISYSIYLNQISVLMVVRNTLGKSDVLSVLSTYLLILIIYSHFTYRYIEKPLRNKVRDMLSRITNPSTPAT